MCVAKPYPGCSWSSISIMRSRSVLAMIDAAAMVKLMPSPLLNMFCGTSTPGTVRASTSTCCGRLGKASTVAKLVLGCENHKTKLRHWAAFRPEINRLNVEQRAAYRNNQEVAPEHARTLLVPKCELAGEVRVLIDACLNL